MESIIAFFITALALGFVGLPLFRERKQDEIPASDAEYLDSEAGRLLSKKDTAITALRELEFDYAVGNLSDDDYRELRDKYERKAISLLKTLDEVSEAESNGRHSGTDRRAVKAALSRRGERMESVELTCVECGEPYEEGDGFCRTCGAELGDSLGQPLVCSGCGEPYEDDDTFCGACGNRLDATSRGHSPAEGGRVQPRAGEAAPFQQGGVSHRRRGRHPRQGRPGSQWRGGR